MKRMLSKTLLIFAAVAIASTCARAQDDAAYLAYRQKVMKGIGTNIGAIGDILKNKLPYSENIVTHAKAMQEASGLIESAFEKKITEGKTDAKLEIWQEWEKYVAAARKLEEESGKLAEVAAGGDMAAIGAAMQKVGDACGSCHKPYRKPKEERFKR